jgi:hypothetical protein
MGKRLSKEQEKALENVLEEETPGFLFFDDNEDDELNDKKQPYGLFHSIPWRIRDMYYSIKYMTQRIFRPNHLSDIEWWNLDLTMAKWIYPRLKTFIKKERHGYPGIFSEYNKNEWKSKEQYEKAIKTGELLGGGPEAWDKILQEMIFAFEWEIYYKNSNNEKQRDKFCKQWGIKNPHEKRIENKYIDYIYKSLEPGFAGCASDDPELDKKEPEKYLFLRRCVRYYDAKYDIEIISPRAQKGFELFGKHFSNLWD